MSEVEARNEPAKLGRDELYRLVWETPLIHLAKRYGITGNGLAKICNRLNVPYPPQGHWARVSRGLEVIKTLLPDAETSTPPKLSIQQAA